jgi:predicted nuclease of predicted toxin-antitoxin system
MRLLIDECLPQRAKFLFAEAGTIAKRYEKQD